MAENEPVFELKVNGMNCGGCSSKLDGYLWKVEGVTGVDVSHEEGRATVRGTATEQALLDAVKAAGFTPVG